MAKSKDSTVVATPAKENNSSSVKAKKTEENKKTAANNNKSEEKPKKDSVQSKSPKDETPKLKEKKPKAKETSAPNVNKETPKAKEAPKKKDAASKKKVVAADAPAESMQDAVPSKNDKKRKLEESASQAPNKAAKSDASATPSEPSARVVCKNLPLKTREATLKSFFKDCGNITDLFLVNDRFTRAFKGIAFASFESVEAAEKAIAMTGQSFLGNDVVVESAAARSTSSEDGPPAFTPGGCFKCGQPGHFSRKCTVTDAVAKCWICRESGHLSRECPTGGGGLENSVCFRCGESGHFSRSCPNSDAVAKCFQCGETGHVMRQCTQKVD